MNWKKLYHLIWLLPAYLLFLGIQQTMVYFGVQKTYNSGHSYVAKVDYYRINNLQAQTNGVVILSFNTKEGNQIRKKLTLPVQMAEEIQDYTNIPIRYLESSFEPIVMIPTYSFQKNMTLIDIGIIIISLVITVGIAIYVERYFAKRGKEGRPDNLTAEITDI
jgi:hypothetical protein